MAYVCSCSVHLIVCCVHCYAVRLIIAFVDVNKTYLILSLKKDSGKLAIRPDHPRRRTEVKVCMPGGLRCVVLYFKFH